MKKSIYQIQIVLKYTKPRIWRRILIRADTQLADFHKIIQTTMGWTNSHLHQFIKEEIIYTVKRDEDDWWDDSDSVDYSNIRIQNILNVEKDKIAYEYDFGDGWMHDIKLEKILPDTGEMEIPVCTGGKMNCPPEDCGGVWGYYTMLEILNDPSHEEFESWKMWLEEDFDPEHFDKDSVNELLKEEDFGCFDTGL